MPTRPTDSARPATTHDVARRAGVSQATVSLVLGGNPRARVSAQTRERVVRAAGELGYRPNILARGLVQRKSYAIGVMVPDLSNPFFLDVVTGVQRVAAEAGYAVLPGDTRDTTPARHLEALRARLVDGVVIDGLGAAGLPDDVLADMKVVLVDEPSERWPGVASDAQAAGRLAAEHLIGLGRLVLSYWELPADTLAGSLWRLFLLRSWVHTNAEGVSREFAAVVADRFLGAGFDVLLSDRPTPSQTISFTAKHRRALGGQQRSRIAAGREAVRARGRGTRQGRRRLR